jgi:hypothetical protein
MNTGIFNKKIAEARELIKSNEKEWKPRYDGYAKKILKNIPQITCFKGRFNQWKPLYIYMNITEATGEANTFNLRYKGQSVADLKIKGVDIILDVSCYQKNNKEYFGMEIQKPSEFPWGSREAAHFRKFFQTCTLPGKSLEHALESKLLSELEKRGKIIKDELLHNIQPVKIAGLCRFQMPTPLGASKKGKLKYSGCHVGSIDILARVGSGPGTSLCIMELKQDADAQSPETVMSQALAYAVFIQELLACKSGPEWFSIFGFKANKPRHNPTLKVCSVIVMPSNKTAQHSFHEQIDTELGLLELRHMNIDKGWQDAIKVIDTNISQ